MIDRAHTSRDLSSAKEGIFNLHCIDHHHTQDIHLASFGRRGAGGRTGLDGSFDRGRVDIVRFDVEALGQEALCPVSGGSNNTLHRSRSKGRTHLGHTLSHGAEADPSNRGFRHGFCLRLWTVERSVAVWERDREQ